MILTPAIEYERGFLCEHQTKRALDIADVDRLEVGIQDQYRVIHNIQKL